MRRTIDDAAAVAAAKGTATVAVVLPARNEAGTVGPIVEVIRRRLVEEVALVDDLVVVDDHSDDATATEAAEAGARVLDARALGPGPGPGKGEALWTSLRHTTADIVCWCDADVADFDGSYVVALVGALLDDPGAVLAKGRYRRPVDDLAGIGDHTGGRVTELVARPLIALLHPALAEITQPLAGEFAARRDAVASVPFARGYAVDLALLIDLADRFGAARIVQVDLGMRRHTRQPLLDLTGQAAAITAMALARSGVPVPEPAEIVQPTGRRVPVVRGDLPPIRR